MLCAPTPFATAQTKQILPLRDIANQTQEDITTILGPQSSLNTEDAGNAICANCQKYAYQNDRIIIEYTNDMADRITIRPPAGARAEDVPTLIGLVNKKANSVAGERMVWTDFAGIREISAYITSDGTLDYIVVKVLTL